MAETFFLVTIVFLVVILLTLTILFFVVRQNGKQLEENASVYCPIAICKDGSTAQELPPVE